VGVRRSARCLWAIGAVIAFGQLSNSPAAACSGTRLLPDGRTAFDEAAAVFTGTVVRRDAPVRFLTYSSADLIAWTVVVDNVRKGEVGSRVTVYSERSDASCGVEFELGHRYEVFGYSSDGRLHAGIGDVRDVGLPDDPPPIESGGLYVDDFGALVPPLAALAILGVIVSVSVAAFAGGRRALGPR
jgi:hypothetical protein